MTSPVAQYLSVCRGFLSTLPSRLVTSSILTTPSTVVSTAGVGAHPAWPSTGLHVVIGNEACDADSIVSALLLGFLKSKTVRYFSV